MRKEPGYWIPYVIGAIGALVLWPITMGFSVAAICFSFIFRDSKHELPLALLALAIGIGCMLLAIRYLGYDLSGMSE